MTTAPAMNAMKGRKVIAMGKSGKAAAFQNGRFERRMGRAEFAADSLARIPGHAAK